MDRFTVMETFICVVETGSFSAAARRLNVGQPAVSKSIAALEERLGVRLILRSTRGLTPTEAGQHYYERAKRSVEEANEAEGVARGTGKGLSGKLRVSAAVTFSRLHIIPRLSTFLNAHPEFVRAPLTAEELFGHGEWISPEGDLKTLPCHLGSQGGMDGFYAARLRRL